ncbi:hypothetical protein GETHLI_22290 [Geothrix limicola]|uniref:Uncharacterized protein n=1 Tax=Geothrix limicola TaxID=2927978 RepID=A0ABQ5QGK3_9BACT|nr:hypothetical protein [Geothrix limicola]GLH73727.1 hypothetical protein GETHLI_22290 [Geothrix limicola]
MATNDLLLIVVAAFFGYLLLAIRQDEKRKVERRTRDLGPPGDLERRSMERRLSSPSLVWAFRAMGRSLGRHLGGRRL